MSFLQTYFSKVVQTTELAVNKTKSLSSRSRLRAAIATEEEMIRRYYMQIGQVYLHKHADDPEECFLPFIQGIEESKQRIASWSDEP